MRVNKDKIVNGIVGFVEQEVLPHITDDKATVILLSTAVGAIKMNPKLVDSVFTNPIIRAMLDAQDDGTYDIGPVMSSIGEAIDKYGSFPITLPAIPVISPTVKEFRFNHDDILNLREKIEGAVAPVKKEEA